jgi:hypothetical protein
MKFQQKNRVRTFISVNLSDDEKSVLSRRISKFIVLDYAKTQTKVKIIDVEILNVNIGIASKDLSHADVDGCIISDATYGFVLLQKKPEFGPASITANNCELTDVWTESLIERYSTLILNGKTYNGKKAKLKSLFYE